MKPEVFQFMRDAVNAAKLVGAEGLKFNDEGIFASDDAISFMMIQPHSLDIDFDMLAMADIPGFANRVALFKDGVDVNEMVDKGTGAVRSLSFKAGRTKVEYKCCIPKLVQVPRSVKDTFVAEVQMDEESTTIIQQALNVMRGEEVYFMCGEGEVTVEISAINNDIFKHILPNQIESKQDNTRFIYKYPAKKLLPLLRKNPTGVLKFGERGTVNIEVDGFNFYILQLR